MKNTIRMTPMRGFVASVGRAQATDTLTHSAVSIGIDRTSDDPAVAIALRHADGTMLTCYLDGHQFARLGDLLAEAVAGNTPGATMAVLQ